MIDCNATIDADRIIAGASGTFVCNDHTPAEHRHYVYGVSGAYFYWTDDTPGATPHHDPEPDGRCVPVALPAGAWGVMLGHETVAYFAKAGGHPDPQGAAEAEAARLNGDVPSYSHEDWQSAIVAQQQALRERDRERASRVAAEVNLVDAEARAQRYSEALEQIGFGRIPTEGWWHVRALTPIDVPAAYARHVLGGEA